MNAMQADVWISTGLRKISVPPRLEGERFDFTGSTLTQAGRELCQRLGTDGIRQFALDAQGEHILYDPNFIQALVNTILQPHA